MHSITDEDKKLFNKFEKAILHRPNENEAVDFWMSLNPKKYDRLITLFENNKVEAMPKNVRLKLIMFFEKIKERKKS